MVEITTDDTFNIFKSKKFGYLGGSDFAVSDDGLTWSIIQHYTDLSLTNPSTALINGYYYIADDTGIRKIKDFNTFFDVNAKISDDKHSNLNNFEWFQNLNGSWYIKYNASTDTGTFTYYADFDETTDSFVNAFNQFVLPTGGASGLQYVRGKYYIWQSGDKLYRADNFTDKFEQVKTDIAGNTNHKQFSSVVSDNYLYVYFAVDGKTYVRSSKVTNLIHWSEPVEVGNVELGSYFYNHSAISVYPDHDKVTTFDKVLKVTANGFKQTVPISCMVLSSLQVQWGQNSTYQISFTAFDDGSVSYTMLSEEAQVEFNGQNYIIKQAVEDASGGVDTKTITASHIYNEINRVRQRKTKTGTLTYSIQDVLSFYLDDEVANSFGFTWSVFGDFDKQQIENLGNSSGSDMLAKIIEQWPQAIIYPDNKLIRVYTPEAFAKDYGGRIDYLHNNSDVKMTVDSTTIANQVKVFGKQIENTNDNADDNAPVKYYFEPFIVSDKASIDQYGLHPMDDISDERFTDKSKMTVFAKGQLSPNPAVSIEVTMEDNEVPYAGEKRHLIAKPLNLETDLTVIGYTWYPFDNAQKNSLSFANLPASILKTQANINNRIRMVQLMAQQAVNAAKTGTRNFVSQTDPMKNDNNDIRTGDIWTLPLLDNKTKSLVRSVNVESEDDSDTNETIYTDPEKMDKINVQFSIWNGSQWLELSNQRTTNKLNDNINSVASQVQEAQAGIATAVQQAQDAVNKANQAITDASFATDTANTAKQVADSVKDDVDTAKSDSATALQQAKDAMTNATDAKTTADNIKTNVDTIKGELTSKADKTDVDAVTNRVTTAETNISQNTKDIESKADNTTVNTLSGEVTQNTSDIKQNAKDITSKVSSSDVQGMLDNGGYATQSWTGSQIDQKADEISSTVTEVSNKINNMQIGGTNLLLDTSPNSTNPSHMQGAHPVAAGTYSRRDTYEQLTAPASGEMYYRFCSPNVNNGMMDLIPGQKYTFSGRVHASAGMLRARIQYYAGNGWLEVRGSAFPITTGGTGATLNLQPFSVTFIVPEQAQSVYVSFEVLNYTPNKTYLAFAEVKLESGNVATDWSPAPEDMATVTALSKVDQKADSISSTVTNNKSDADTKFTNINQTISGIQSTVKDKADSSTVTQLANLVDSKVNTSDYNSKVTQLANDINLRVQSKDLLSQINIQAGSTLIQSNKLYLDSSSVVFSGKAFIPSASIASLSADKVNTGVLTSKNGKTYFDLNNNLINILSGDNNASSNMKLTDGALSFSYKDIAGTNQQGQISLDYSVSYDDINQVPNWLHDFLGKLETSRKPGVLRIQNNDFIKIGDGINSELNMMNVDKYQAGHQWQSGLDQTLNAFSYYTNNGNVHLSSADAQSHVKLQKKNRNGDWIYLSMGNPDGKYYNDASNDYMYLNASLFSFTRPQGNILRISTNDGTPMIQGDVPNADLWLQSQKGIILNGAVNTNGHWVGAGSLSVSGSKNSVVPTSKGTTLINAYETAEYYFGDLGQNNTGASSEIVVPIDKIFSETVRTDIPYHVFVSSYSDSNVWVTDRTETSFTVHSSEPNTDFSWELKAKRRGFENDRLEQDQNAKYADWNNYQEAKDAGASEVVLKTYIEKDTESGDTVDGTS